MRNNLNMRNKQMEINACKILPFFKISGEKKTPLYQPKSLILRPNKTAPPPPPPPPPHTHTHTHTF